MEKISDKKQTRNFELNRQLFHLFLGIVAVFLLVYDFIGKEIVFLNLKIPYADILILIIFGFLLSHMAKKIKIPVINQLLQQFERKEELKTFPGRGIIFYFIGIYIALLAFPKEIAMASIMVLALGDSVSHAYGVHFGKIKHPFSKTKFLEGTIAGFAAGFIGAFVFLPWHEAFFASLAAMIAEAVEIKIGAEQVDDNLIIPFVAGAAVWVARLL